MRKLIEIVAALALLLNVSATLALADSPSVSAEPDVRPGPQNSTAGGSASATGGDAGPATVTTSDPITASSSNSTYPGGPSSGSTSATGPGTKATVPATASGTQPDPSAPDGSAPTTSGPDLDADASQSSVSASDSRVRANAVATVTGSFAGSAAGIGTVEDPTYASTCSTAEASPGVPTDASLRTNCGTEPSSVSEDYSANGSDGNGAAGNPSGSSCLSADASAGASPTAQLSNMCTPQGGTNGSIPSSSDDGRMSGAQNGGASSNDSNAGPSRNAGSILGIAGLPSTATEPGSLALFGATLALAGVALLGRSRRENKVAGRASKLAAPHDAIRGQEWTHSPQ